MTCRAVLALVTAATAALAATGIPATAAPAPAANYIVTLAAPPAATYGGGVSGLAATRARTGARMATRSAAVVSYRSHLLRDQARLLRTAGVRARAQYTMTLNGFAARLTAAQAARLAGSRGVLSVTRDTLRKPHLFADPEFLGLTGPRGGWQQAGGEAGAGRGVVVGMLDGGIWPENPFFAGAPVQRTTPGRVGSVFRDPADGKLHVVKADGEQFTGTCQPGEMFTVDLCDSKVVGARFYDATFREEVPDRDDLAEHEYVSPRDGSGHGSHTASTATGNRLEGMSASGRAFGASAGMAPAAKVAVYKICWEAADAEQTGCWTSDTLQAIDDAVADGVDVLNYSVGGGTAPADDPVELAFLNAAAAGVFVATSAGNEGPGASTVDHNSPWLTTVAASSSRRFVGTVRLGDGTQLRGASWGTAAVPASPAVLGREAGAGSAGSGSAQAARCDPGTLDPAKATGRVVVCDRAGSERREKSAEVKRAGGAGMVLVNPEADTLDADPHAVPTVHLSHLDRPELVAYLGTADPTIELLPGDLTGRPETPLAQLASFSSRGPDLTSEGGLLKPDLSAPGVDVVAAVTPGPAGGELFGPMSGTSMAAPHVAGLAAVVLGRWPGWSPAAVKSALMTTTTNLREGDGTWDRDLFGGGAGQVDARDMLNPGLVYESGVTDWLRFLEGRGFDTGSGLPPLDASDLNLPSIAVGRLSGTRTVTRRVTAVEAGTYRARIAVPGVQASVTPGVLRLRKGQSASFRVTFARTGAALDRYAAGHLVWTSGRTTVRSPIAVQPVAVTAPAEVAGSGASGSVAFRIRSGINGSLPLSVQGLAAGAVTPGTVAIGEANPVPGGDEANRVHEVTVPEGTTLARFEVQAEDEGDDLDLFLLDENFQLVEQAATVSAGESITIDDPAPGGYHVVVNGFASDDDAPAGYRFRSFAVPSSPSGDLVVAPDPVPVALGQRARVVATWSELAEGTPYLGWIGYAGSADRTIVAVG